MHLVLRRIVLLVTLMTAVAASSQAVDWADYATVSMTDPLTPKLSANKLCYSDGRDLLCDGAAGLIVTSGTVQVPGLIAGGITVTGNTSATYISTTAIQITSQTTATTCSSGNAGTLRYNSPTTTLELCTGSGWQPMGVGIPAGTISAFASTTCPTGWSEYTAARGRFLRGIDNGAGLDPSGTRAPGNAQADDFRSHTRQQSVNSSAGSGTNAAPGVNSSGPTGYGTYTSPAGGLETRPVNVAVTFCQFNGTSNGWNNPLSGGGGGATPAGSTSDIQFNSAGALAADTGLFTYASGILKAPTVSTTNISATTASLNSLGAGNIAAINISTTGGIKVGNVATTCATGISGTMRYNTASNTMEYCNGSAWANLGPSSTQPVAFSVNKNGTDQTVSTNTTTKLTWSNEVFDTNNNFASDRFTPTIPGKYLLSTTVYCPNSTTHCGALIYKNGSAYISTGSGGGTSGGNQSAVSIGIVDMNGTTDYVEVYGVNYGGTTISGQTYSTFFSGVLLSPQGGGSGGTATPAGSTADIQYNSGGALAADTGLFTYASGVLKAPTVSSTNISATTASLNSLGAGNIAAINISTTGGVKVGNVATTCATGISGTMRYNTASNTMEYCNGSIWANMGPSATTPVAFSVNKGSTIQTVTTATDTLLTWPTKAFDTNNNFASNRFTPTVPGKFIFTLDVGCADATTYCGAYILKNGVKVAISQSPNDGTAWKNVVAILDMNSSSDYVEAYVYNGGGTTIYGSSVTSFAGAMLAPQGGGSGGTATPAGSTADVQYNSGGALAADTGLFTYASGVLKAPTVSSTNISATTATLNSLGAGNIAAINISTTGGIKVGNITTTCATGISGTMRYNTASNTMEYCNGSAWANLGPSTTTPISFNVHRGASVQTVTANTATKVLFTTEDFDTNNAFDTTSSRFQPTTPGKYLVTGSVYCPISGSSTACIAYIYKNGSAVFEGYQVTANDKMVPVSGIVDLNGTSDYIELYGATGGTSLGGDRAWMYLSGAILSSQGGGSGGTATPAGSTADIQFNSAGALAADTGNLTYASSVLKAPTISATNLNGGSVSATTATFSGSIQYGGTGSESCSSAADYGKSRKNPTSGRIQVCLAH